MSKRSFICTIIYCLLIVFQSFASDLYDEAVAVFRANKPQEAKILLAEVIQKEGADASLYNYLGIAYYQTNELDLSLDAFLKGAKVPFANKSLLYYNAGNSAFAQKDFAHAEEYYTESLKDDELYASAYLNRANARIKLLNNAGALADYEQYLELKPDCSQKDAIASVVAYLKNIVPQEEQVPVAIKNPTTQADANSAQTE